MEVLESNYQTHKGQTFAQNPIQHSFDGILVVIQCFELCKIFVLLQLIIYHDWPWL